MTSEHAMRTNTSARQTRARSRTRRGFSLVSAIVAIILLGVGVSALAHANGQTITLQVLAQNRTNAIAIGRSYLEQVRARDPWMVESEPSTNVDSEGRATSGGPFRRTVTVTELRQNLVSIEVRVDFPRGRHPITLNTMLFRGNGLAGVE